MTKLMTTLTIAAIASILVVGGFVASPEAYSTYGGWGDDDDDDDCGHYGNYGHHNDDDDDCGNNEPRDPCDCEKPDTLKFRFATPDTETNTEFKIEIYKKISYIGNDDKKLTSIADVTHMGDYQIESSSFGKDKLNSNTVFAVYKTVENADDILVSSIEIHTSCSQDLYIGQTESDGGYSLEITDGLKNGETSISASNPQTCGDEPEPEQTGTIVIKNALTNDNGGEAEFVDFSYKVTNEIGEETDLVQDTLDPSIHVAEVPKGAYILSQTIASTTGTYTEVLITGDKKCPATTNESFMIKKDKTVSCTIYNDDNGDGSGGPSTPGVAFGFNGFEWNHRNLNSTGNQCPSMPSGGCVEQLVNNQGGFVIIDPLLQKTSNTIVTWSMTAKDLNAFNAHNCSIVGIFESQTGVTAIDESGNTVPAKGFGLFCSILPFNGGDGADWNINYAFIETED